MVITLLSAALSLVAVVSPTDDPAHFFAHARGWINGYGDVGARARFDDAPRPGYQNRFGFRLRKPVNVENDTTVDVTVACNGSGALIIDASGLFYLEFFPDDPAVADFFTCVASETRHQRVRSWQDADWWFVRIED